MCSSLVHLIGTVDKVLTQQRNRHRRSYLVEVFE